jgi:hypothetical protein
VCGLGGGGGGIGVLEHWRQVVAKERWKVTAAREAFTREHRKKQPPVRSKWSGSGVWRLRHRLLDAEKMLEMQGIRCGLYLCC